MKSIKGRRALRKARKRMELARKKRAAQSRNEFILKHGCTPEEHEAARRIAGWYAPED